MLRLETRFVITFCLLIGASFSSLSVFASDDISLSPRSWEESLPLEAAPQKIPTLKEQIFVEEQTISAGDRLRNAEKIMAEKDLYQLTSSTDVLRYQRDNHDTAVWYVKALLRAKMHELIHLSRRRLREDKARNQTKQRALAARAERERNEHANRAIASESSVSEVGPDEHDEPQVDLRLWIAQATAFVERFTNDGLTIRMRAPVRDIHSMFRFDVPNATVQARLGLPILDFAAAVRVFDKEDPFPGIKGGGGSGDRFVLKSSQGFSFLGFGGSLSYDVLHHRVGCSLSRQVVSWLVASYDRSWTLGNVATETMQVQVSSLF